MPDIRDQILTVLADKALKKSTIATRAGLTPDQFSAILKHRRRLDANELFRVCAAMGMTADEVASWKGVANDVQAIS